MSEKYFVFIDVDGTLLQIKSMFSFLKFHWTRETYGPITGRIKYWQYWRRCQKLYQHSGRRELINIDYYQQFAGLTPGELKRSADVWWQAMKQQYGGKLINPVCAELIKKHQGQGAEIVLVSGSCGPLLSGLKDELSISHLLSSQLVLDQGKYTGQVEGQAMIGVGKSKAIEEFIHLQQSPVNLEACYAYGDHFSDIPMLEMTGNNL